MKYLILLLLTSCASGYHSYTDNKWHPDNEIVLNSNSGGSWSCIQSKTNTSCTKKNH